MSTVSGNKAEEKAVSYLKERGFKILDRNWRRPRCEIDIVASFKPRRFSKEKIIHFVEVKYRRNDEHGSGLDYITPQKIGQMKFAARMWVAENAWEGDYELSAIAVAGEEFSIKQYLPKLDL